MLTFCKYRWIENVKVSEGKLLRPHVKRYDEMVERGELPNPKVKSYEEVKNGCSDPLFPVKVVSIICRAHGAISEGKAPGRGLIHTEAPSCSFSGEQSAQGQF